MDLCGRGNRTDSAKPKLVDLERVAGAEGRPDIVGATDVVQHYDNAGFGEHFVFLGRDPVQLYVQ